MKPKVLFLHIPKTGGSSFSYAPFILLQGTVKQDPAIAVKDNKLLGCFTFVRNPYTRFSSAVMNHGFATPKTFEKFVITTFLDRYKEEFEKWTDSKWQVLQPQYRHVYHQIDSGELEKWKGIDIIGRFENMEEDWKKVCKLAKEDFKLPHANKNKYPFHSKYHTDKTRGIVARVYKRDFELFGYDI